MTSLAERLSQLRRQISRIASSCDRDPSDIRLVAVSKTRPVEDILAAVEAGQRVFGENYLQDALPKIAALRDRNLEWHFIGRIQSNKTREIAGNFAWVHALEKLKHARRLDSQRPDNMPPLNACIQLNLTGETSKGGIAAEELPELLENTRDLPHLKIRGLMTMPPASAGETLQHHVFGMLRKLLEEMNRQGHELDTLSMGMSGDMQAAICEGATMVRIGTAIFGPRNRK